MEYCSWVTPSTTAWIDEGKGVLHQSKARRSAVCNWDLQVCSDAYGLSTPLAFCNMSYMSIQPLHAKRGWLARHHYDAQAVTLNEWSICVSVTYISTNVQMINDLSDSRNTPTLHWYLTCGPETSLWVGPRPSLTRDSFLAGILGAPIPWEPHSLHTWW